MCIICVFEYNLLISRIVSYIILLWFQFRGSPPVTDLKKVKSREEVMVTMALFLGGREDTRQRLLARLKEIRVKFEQSSYFQRHEVVGSSIFMIYDDTKVGAWIIDFAKTLPVPDGQVVSHRQPWVQGNHEEGFLTGLDSLISVSILQLYVYI
jgi:1D-myo-inositol-triphosphate 3-kinase